MAAQTYRFSPFATQHISPAAERNAPGRPFASPPRASVGRTPSSTVETDHAQASLSDTAVGRPVSGLHARRLGDDPDGPAADLLHLARRLERGARDAGRVAGNLDILAARLSVPVGLCESYSHQGLTYAVNEHAEHAKLLADAHAVVVRMADFPEILDVLSALEHGAEVIVRTAESHASSPSHAAGVRSCKTGAVGGEHNPTLSPRKLWSGLINFVSAGHRKSSSPAHQCAPASLRSPSTTEATDAWSTNVCKTINRKVV